MTFSALDGAAAAFLVVDGIWIVLLVRVARKHGNPVPDGALLAIGMTYFFIAAFCAVRFLVVAK